MKVLTRLTKALSDYGFNSTVEISKDPGYIDHRVNISNNIYISASSSRDYTYYSLWFIDTDGQHVQLVLNQSEDPYYMAKSLYNLVRTGDVA